MNEPPRIVQQHVGSFEAQLLKAARRDGPSLSAKQKTLVAISAGGVILTTSGVAASFVAKAWKLTAAGWFKWLFWGSIGGSVAAIGVTKLQATMAESKAPTEIVDSVSAAHPSTKIAGTTSATPMPEASTAPSSSNLSEAISPERLPTTASGPSPRNPIIVRKPNATATSPEPSARPPDASGTQARLAAEVALIDAARKAVLVGDGARARQVLVRYRDQFPQGFLSSEAKIVEVNALLLEGERGRAASAAQAYVEEHPGSPQANRLRQVMSDAGGGKTIP